MTSKLQTVLVFGAALGVLSFGSACKVTSCPDGDGGTKANCAQGQLPTKYIGTGVDKSMAWASGKNITVVSPNGEVTVDAAGPADQVVVSVKPFAFDYDEPSAQTTMNTKLQYNTDEPNGAFTLVSGSGSAGFDITVHLPPSFNAGLDVEQNNGEVTINSTGAAALTKVRSQNGGITAGGFGGGLYLQTANGAIVASGGITGTGNLIHTDLGNVTYTLSEGPNLTITAKAASGNVILGMPVPPTWTVTGASPSETITVGDASGQVEVSSDFGDVTLL